ncbi:FAD:protein FMN transferase [Mucilaginibacter sp. AW1-3]
MDINFEISVVADDEIWAVQRIDDAFTEIIRIEKLLTDNQLSQTSRINSYAGIEPVKVDQELYNLIDRSWKIAELTHGSFDITRGSLNVNYRDIILQPAQTSVFLKEKGMKIDFSSISKGYIADRVKYFLQMQGVSSGVINVAGNLITWGNQPDGSPWTVSAAAPAQSTGPIANLNISNMAVITSGNNGYFNTKTGLAVSSIKSVSILSPSAELAAAMGTPVMVMGVRVGLNLINRLNQIACVITNHRKKIYTSKNLSYR